MSEKEFFKMYLKALEKTLASEEESDDFQETDHYDFFDGEDDISAIEKFELENYNKYKLFFDNSHGYFDARNHNFLSDGQISLSEFREKLLERIKMYKTVFDI
jgi:hypothetical protein